MKRGIVMNTDEMNRIRDERAKSSVEIGDVVQIHCGIYVDNGVVTDKLNDMIILSSGMAGISIKWSDIDEIRVTRKVFDRSCIPLECVDGLVYLEGSEKFRCLFCGSWISTEPGDHVCPDCGVTYNGEQG